jgi:hypothetical protein
VGLQGGDEMDVPCPKFNSIDLKKVSLSYEEGRYCPSKRSIVQILVATAAASKSLLAARQQNRVTGRTFRAES